MVLAWIANGCLVIFLIGACVHLPRQRRRRARRPAKELMISPLSGLAMGAMLLGLQAIVQPDARHAIVEEQKEDSIDDESGMEPPGGRLFHEQLRRIRCGDEVEEVTFSLKSDPASADRIDQAEASAGEQPPEGSASCRETT
jgi:hypothetical protein